MSKTTLRSVIENAMAVVVETEDDEENGILIVPPRPVWERGDRVLQVLADNGWQLTRNDASLDLGWTSDPDEAEEVTR